MSKQNEDESALAVALGSAYSPRARVLGKYPRAYCCRLYGKSGWYYVFTGRRCDSFGIGGAPTARGAWRDACAKSLKPNVEIRHEPTSAQGTQ